ncbi:MAG UNVERIFIED_CONTAM: hypothetical protein LVR29_12360 [Microcystis novacekii LVE1205-3]
MSDRVNREGKSPPPSLRIPQRSGNVRIIGWKSRTSFQTFPASLRGKSRKNSRKPDNQGRFDSLTTGS